MTFEDYLRNCMTVGIIDFHIRPKADADGKISFYIHPANVNGDTEDFIVTGNQLTPIQTDTAGEAE